MRYESLFNIAIRHAYFKDDRCRDFELVPDAESTRAFRQYGLLWRPSADTWKVVIPLDDNQKPIKAIPLGKVFRLYIYAKQPGVLQVSEFHKDFRLSAALKGEALIRYTNNDTELLDADIFTFEQSDRFQVQIPDEKEIFYLQGTPVSSISAADFILEGIQSGMIQYQKGEKRIFIDSREVPAKTWLVLRYRAIPPWWSSGIIGFIDIKTDLLGKMGRNYRINVEQESADWTYYIVTDIPYDELRLDLQENENQAIEFTKQDLRKITEKDLLPIEQWMIKKYPENGTGTVLSRFRSPPPMPYSEKQIRIAQLKQQKNTTKNGQVTVILKPNLPIPSQDNNASQILTYFTKSNKP